MSIDEIVKVTGENIPSAITSFSSSGLRPLLLENIERFRFNEPTPVQKHCLPIIMSGRDLMCCSPTGSGKTAAFLLPILHKLIEVGADSHAGDEVQTPQCVIITPTSGQAIQISIEAHVLANPVIKCVSSYNTRTNKNHKNYQIRQLQKGCNILICTPESMLDLVDEGKLSFRNLKYLVMDRADRILELPEVLECIRNSMPTVGEKQMLLFASSFPDEMQLTAQEFLREGYPFVTVGVTHRAVEEEEVVNAIGFNDLLENTDEAQTEGENRIVRQNDLEDIKSNMRIHFIENIQAANCKLAAKEKEFKGNEDNRKREEKEMKERQDGDMKNIDFMFESDINKLEENKKEEEQKLAMIKTNLAEMKQKKKTEQEAAIKSQRDELHMLNARQTQDKRDEKNTLTNLKKMSDQLSRNLDDLDLQPTNEEPPRKKAKLEAARATLECPVCLEEMKPPTKIWMCTASHIVCGPCKARLAGMACPTCRDKGITLRAHMAEKFARSVFNN